MPDLYIPSKGDVVWLDFSPQAGHEQSGNRPALCISPKEYNEKTGLAIFCPITSHSKGYPFEVPLPDNIANIALHGVLLADHIKSLDWRIRHADYIYSIPERLLAEVLGKLRTLL